MAIPTQIRPKLMLIPRLCLGAARNALLARRDAPFEVERRAVGASPPAVEVDTGATPSRGSRERLELTGVRLQAKLARGLAQHARGKRLRQRN